MYDFPDFYCAGVAFDRAKSPYTYEPLRTCEHIVNDAERFRADPALAVPAPQPPYDLPLFGALAKMGFARARAVSAVAIVMAMLLSAIVLWRLGIPLVVALLGLALSGFQELYTGQIVPLVLLFLVLTGWMLARRREQLAGVFAGLTAIEPHLGAPVVLAVLLFASGARLSLIATGILMAALSIALVGPGGAAAYAAHIVPAQAAAEVGFGPQYSLTFALHVFGLRDALALRIGSLSLCVIVVAGLLLAPRLATRLQRRDLLVFFPAATAVMGGMYVHGIELCFAIPAALVLACCARGMGRDLAAVAVSLLNVPWITAWTVKKLFLASIFASAVLLYRLRTAAAISVATVLLVGVVLYIAEHHPPWLPAAPHLPAESYLPGTLVQVEWQEFVRGLQVHDPLWVAIKFPAWIGLAALFVAAVLVARPTEAQLLQKHSALGGPLADHRA